MTWAGRLRLAAVLAFRDARGSPGSCVLTTLSLALAVAGMHGMQWVATQLSQHVASNNRQWIAADAAVELDHSLSPTEWREARAIAPNVLLTLVTELPAMASSNQAPDPAAVQLKAVDPGVYPFYGALEVKSGRSLRSCLDSGSTIVSQDLLDALQVRPGAMIRIREADFRIADVIAAEPDRFAGPYAPTPRVIVSTAGLDRTGLLRFSDSAFYHLLFRIQRSENTVEICRRLEKLFPNAEVIDYTTPMPLVGVTADWIVPFLSVMAVLALAFGVGAIAALSYLHLLQRLDTLAILKSLGATSTQITGIFLLQTIGLALIGSSLGVVGGWLAQPLGASIVLRQMGIHLEAGMQLGAAIQSLLLGVLAAVVAASASLWTIRPVRPAIILRRDAGERDLLVRVIRNRMRPGLGVVVGLIVPTVLLFWLGGAWRTRVLILACIAGAAAGIHILVRGAVAIGSRVGRLISTNHFCAMRQGLANLHRYGRQTRGVLLVLVASVMLVLIAGSGRRQIADQIVDSLPFGAPELLFFNADASDASQLSRLLTKKNGVIRPPVLLPTALLTLARVDDAGLDTLRVSQARKWIPRRWPATCSDARPEGVHILAGNWWKSNSAGTPVAIEEAAALLLGVHVGSRVEFLVAGRPLETEVMAVIRVPPMQRYWYRLTLGCSAFAGFEAILYSGGVSVGSSRRTELHRRLQEGVRKATVVDVSEMKKQAENIGAEGVAVLTVAAAVLACLACALLLTAVLALRPFRIYEIAILRALGASRRTLLSGFAIEYGALGSIAGLLGAPLGLLGADLVLWYVTGKWTWILDPASVIFAVCGVTLLVAAVGVGASRALLRLPPLQVLRRR